MHLPAPGLSYAGTHSGADPGLSGGYVAFSVSVCESFPPLAAFMSTLTL
jgi:hypothetical protein